MAARATTLLLWIRRDGWSAYRCDAPQEEPVASGETIGDAPKALVEAKLASVPVVVAFESDLCLVSRFEVASRRQARRREVLNYQVEEPLPVAAEELVSDFIVDGVHVLGVSSHRTEVERTLEALSDLDVRCVAPLAILAAEELRHTDSAGCSLWFRPHAIEQLNFQREKPSAWRTLPVDPEAFRSLITAQELTGETSLEPVCIGDRRRIADFVTDEGVSILECEGDPCGTYAIRMANRIGLGLVQPTIDFRRDPSLVLRASKNPLRWEQRLFGAACLLVVLAAAGWQFSAAAASERKLHRLEAAEAQVFRDVFPEKRVPLGVRTRLESELRSISGARPQGQSTADHRDAALRLQSLTESLPGDLRFRLTEVRIEAARVNLLGEARSHADADRIAAAIRGSGLTVAPPSTRQLVDQGVEFRISAEESVASPREAR